MTTASGRRYRVVTQQDEGGPHVSSIVLNGDEAAQHLAYEAAMHRLAGWQVTCGPTVVARRNGVVRVLSLKQSDAMTDAR